MIHPTETWKQAQLTLAKFEMERARGNVKDCLRAKRLIRKTAIRKVYRDSGLKLRSAEELEGMLSEARADVRHWGFVIPRIRKGEFLGGWREQQAREARRRSM